MYSAINLDLDALTLHTLKVDIGHIGLTDYGSDKS